MPNTIKDTIDNSHREIHFNDGSRWVATEPEIQELLAIMFETPRPVEEEPIVVKKKVVKKK